MHSHEAALKMLTVRIRNTFLKRTPQIIVLGIYSINAVTENPRKTTLGFNSTTTQRPCECGRPVTCSYHAPAPENATENGQLI